MSDILIDLECLYQANEKKELYELEQTSKQYLLDCGYINIKNELTEKAKELLKKISKRRIK